MKKKVNPARRPATWADVTRAKHKAQDEALSVCIVLFLTVLLDKFGFDEENLEKAGREINSLSDSVAKGYVKFQDLKKVLEEEYDIRLSF